MNSGLDSSASSRPPVRPLGITLLACFALVGTTASGLSLWSLLTPGGFLEPIWRLNPRAQAGFAQMGSWAFYLLGAVSLACTATAYGLVKGRRWGYRLCVVGLLVHGTADLINALLGIEPRAIVGVPIVALILWYLSRPRVRAYFRPAIRSD